jgi:hypothetical protein
LVQYKHSLKLLNELVTGYAYFSIIGR